MAPKVKIALLFVLHRIPLDHSRNFKLPAHADWCLLDRGRLRHASFGGPWTFALPVSFFEVAAWFSAGHRRQNDVFIAAAMFYCDYASTGADTGVPADGKPFQKVWSIL